MISRGGYGEGNDNDGLFWLGVGKDTWGQPKKFVRKGKCIDFWFEFIMASPTGGISAQWGILGVAGGINGLWFRLLERKV